MVGLVCGAVLELNGLMLPGFVRLWINLVELVLFLLVKFGGFWFGLGHFVHV